MKATTKDLQRLLSETRRVVEQMKELGAVKVILFGSLARQEISLFSDIDILVLFDNDRSSRDLGLWVYQNLDAREAVDVLAYNRRSFESMKQRPFIRHILSEAKVLYEKPEARS
jgi:predicted nucleotidyltransferase